MAFFFKLYVLLNVFLGTSIENFLGLTVDKTNVFNSIHFRTLPLLIICIFLARNKKLFGREFLMIGICFISLTISLLMNKSSMFAVMINNTIEPILLLCVLRNCDYRLFVKKTLLIFFIIECTVACYEVMTKQILFADLSHMAKNNIEYMMESEMRAFSLHGHPLQNAFLVSILSFFFLSAHGKPLYRYGLFSIGFISLLAFNTRSSIYLMAVIAILFIIRDLRGNQLKGNQKYVILVILLCAISVLIIMMKNFDFGSRLAYSLSSKDDSSNTRYMLLSIIANLPTKELLWGMTNGIQLIINKYAFAAIENSLANFIVTNGLIYTVCWCILIYMCLYTVSPNKTRYKYSFIIFFTLLNANNSLMTDTPIIIFYILSLYSLDSLQIKSIITNAKFIL